jgi:hypothetical protein
MEEKLLNLFYWGHYLNKVTTSQGYTARNVKKETWSDIIKILSRKQISTDKAKVNMFNLCEFDVDPSTAIFYNPTKISEPIYNPEIGFSKCEKNVRSISGLILDYDAKDRYVDIKEIIKNYNYIAYSSYNHNIRGGKYDPKVEKFRVILPFESPVGSNEIMRRVESLLQIFPTVDRSTFARARAFYIPSCSSENEKYSFYEAKKDGFWFDLLSLKATEIYEFDPDNYEELPTPPEITEENKQQIIEAISTVSKGLHYVDVFRIITFLKKIGFSVNECQRSVIPYEDPTSTIRGDFAKIKELYNKADSKKLGLSGFKKIILERGGSIDGIKIWSNRGIQKLLDVEPQKRNRFTLAETEENIREGLRDYFYNENNTVLSQEPGSGKTQEVINAITNLFYKETGEFSTVDCSKVPKVLDTIIDVFVFNKQNQKEFLDKLNEVGVNVVPIMGREEFCTHEIFKIKQDKNHPDHSFVKDIKESEFCTKDCPFAKSCGYPKQYKKAKDAFVTIKHHSFLFNKDPHWETIWKRKPTHIIIDEEILGQGLKIYSYKIGDLALVLQKILINFKSNQKFDLIEISKLKENIKTLFPQIGFSIQRTLFSEEEMENYLAHPPEPKSPWEELENHFFDLRKQHRAFFANLKECGTDIEKLREYYIGGAKRPPDYHIIKKVIDTFIDLYQDKINDSLCIKGDFLIIREKEVLKDKWFAQTKLLLDATPTIEFLPFEFTKNYNMLTEWSKDLKVIQIKDKTFSKTMLERLPNIKTEIILWLKTLCETEEKIGLISYKILEPYIKTHPILKEFIESGKLIIDHFGNVRGTNLYEDCDTFVVLGQYMENNESIYHKGIFMYGTDLDLGHSFKIKGIYKMRQGMWKEQTIGYHTYNDPRLRTIANIAETNEMLQVFGRIRAIRVDKPKKLYIVSKRPFDVPIDELTTWNSLIGKGYNKPKQKMDKRLELILAGLKKCFRKDEERSSSQLIEDIINFDGCSEPTAFRILNLLESEFTIRIGEKGLRYFQIIKIPSI